MTREGNPDTDIRGRIARIYKGMFIKVMNTGLGGEKKRSAGQTKRGLFLPVTAGGMTDGTRRMCHRLHMTPSARKGKIRTEGGMCRATTWQDAHIAEYRLFRRVEAPA